MPGQNRFGILLETFSRMAEREFGRPGADVTDQRVLRSLPPLGGGADACLDVALQAPGEGPRADAGKLGCLGAACGLPLPAAPGREGITK